MSKKLTIIEKAKRRLMRANIPFDTRIISTEGGEFSYTCITPTYDADRTPSEEKEMVYRACNALRTLSGIKLEIGASCTTFFLWDSDELMKAQSINAIYQDRRDVFHRIRHSILTGCTADYAEAQINAFVACYASIADGWTQKDADALRREAMEHCK